MRICCISQSVIADDPRVRRQAETLAAAGHEVSVVGFGGGRSAPVDLPSFLIDPPAPNSLPKKLGHGLRLMGTNVGLCDSLRTFEGYPRNKALAGAALQVDADLYLANDWTSLPAAAVAARGHGGRFAYDTHELAVDERVESLAWRVVYRRYVRAIESMFIHDAAFVMTVSPGIAAILQRRYDLTTKPVVVRNIPEHVEVPVRTPGDTVTVLYHGGFSPERGLEALIDSVRYWPPDFHLVLRGSGRPEYEQRLRDRVHNNDVDDRVTFVDPVPMTELVAAANESDIGIFPLNTDDSPQRQYALPNKLFEYIMAGLAICVSDVPDMAEVVRTHDVGVLIDQPDAVGIAKVIGSLDRESILRLKKNSVNAARQLCWERESKKLLDVVDSVDP